MDFKVVSPIDGKVWLQREYADAASIERSLEDSFQARKKWMEIELSERINICQRAVDLVLSHAEEIGNEITWQMGRPIRYSPFEIKGGFRERAEFMLSIAERSLQNIDLDSNRYIQRTPLGTVLVLAPWNYPFLTSVNAIIPALVAGNTVILKHSDQVPLTAERYKDAFSEAGLPEGVFQYLHMTHQQVGELLKDKRINYVSFTGSVAGGKAIEEAIAGQFKSSGLELGGKDAAYVRADAKLDFTVDQLVDGSFFNAGQSCCGIERIYVHQELYKDFLELFIEVTNRYVLGDPREKATTMGPMVSSAKVKALEKLIEEALHKGAKKCINRKDRNHGAYFYPEILVDVDHSMSVMREETFAPIVGVVPVKSDREAIQMMNDSKYGLTASLWTKDLEIANQLGRQIKCGTIYTNRCDYLDPALAWTGVQQSGRGCTLSQLGYHSFTRPKSFYQRSV